MISMTSDDYGISNGVLLGNHINMGLGHIIIGLGLINMDGLWLRDNNWEMRPYYYGELQLRWKVEGN